MKAIKVEFVTPAQMVTKTYETLDEYWDMGDHVLFWLVDLGNVNYNMALMAHAVHEYFQMTQHGVTAEDTVSFDMAHPESDDPGWLPGCPYGPYHQQADIMERMVIQMSGENWMAYDERCAEAIAELEAHYGKS